jgi:hypothetical protein
MIITITAVMTIAAYKRKAAGDITTQELQHYETNVGGEIQHQEFISHLATFFLFLREIYTWLGCKVPHFLHRLNLTFLRCMKNN